MHWTALRALLAALFLGWLSSVAAAQGTGGPCLTGSTTVLGCYKVDGTTIIVNGSGVISSSGGAATSIVVGTTTVGSGTTGRVLFDNGAVLGEKAVTGTGSVVLAAAPTITGVAVFSGVPQFTGLSAGTQVSCIGLDASNNLVLNATACGSGGGGGLTVGTTTIASGTTTRVLFDNAGVLGEYTISGTGNVAMTTSPVFTTPNIGTATGHATLDLPLTGGTLTGTLTMSGANIALGANSLTGNFTISGVPVLTGLSTGTIASGKNLGLDSSNNLVVATVSGGSVSVTAGTPNIVITPSPGLTTFTVGGTNPQNAPSDGGSHTYTPVSGDVTKEVVLVSTFTAITPPQATGSFAAGATFSLVTQGPVTATPTTSTANGLAAITLGANQYSQWDAFGGNYLVALGVPQPATQTGTTYLRDDMTWVTPAGAGNVTAAGTLTSGGVVIGQGTKATATAADITFASGILSLGTNTSELGGVKMFGGTSGNVTIEPNAVAGTNIVLTLPATTDTLVGKTTTDTLTNKTLTSPTLTTPTLGVATATTINKVTLTAPATGSTLTVLDGKTLTANNTLVLAGTDSTTMTFPATSQTIAGLGVNQAWTKGQAVTPDTATACGTQSSGGTATPDFSNSNSCQLTFGAGNFTLAAPANVKIGEMVLITLTQDGTGSRTLTGGFPTAFDFGTAGAPTLTTTASKTDVISCYAVAASGAKSLLCTANLGF